MVSESTHLCKNVSSGAGDSTLTSLDLVPMSDIRKGTEKALDGPCGHEDVSSSTEDYRVGWWGGDGTEC